MVNLNKHLFINNNAGICRLNAFINVHNASKTRYLLQDGTYGQSFNLNRL